MSCGADFSCPGGAVGSFNFTCSISGLPIQAGDKVRYMLLAQNPFKDGGNACYIHDIWYPRVFPIRAQYNDYGSIEEYEDGPARDIWMDGFKQDLLEQGWGDNSYHDVPTSKDMTFDAMLEVIWEGRLYVSRALFEQHQYEVEEKGKKPDTKLEALREKDAPKGVPTLQRVQATLKAAGFSLYGGYGGKAPGGGSYMVDEQQYGTVRIRWKCGATKDYGKDEKALSRTLEHFKEYATVITSGTGSYASSADLFLHVKPGTKGFHGAGRPRKYKPQLVAQTMILEDVWQGLCGIGTEYYDEDYECKKATLAMYRKWTRDQWNKSIEGEKQDRESRDPVAKFRAAFARENLGLENPVSSYCAGRNPVPNTIGPSDHWRMMVKRHVDNPIKESQLASWLDSVAEFCLVDSVLAAIRHWWRPSYSCGPQCVEYTDHESALKVYLSVNKKLKKQNSGD
jgi:hypothetical protein